jgi:S-adenosylmethionine-diacylgycerolhomoserine-N-methlytransferase
MGQTQTMNKIYCVQRHFYDATRRLFLPGRNLLLNQINIPPTGSVLEVGCGTGRNLLILARRFPNAQFYGIDISSEMLRTAQRKVRRSGLTNIHLAQTDILTFNPHEVFAIDQPFDAAFFSYSICMIPDWRKALKCVMACLSPNGSLHVVDFWDQRDWPGIIRRLLIRWLGFFHVRYEPAMIDTLKTLAENNSATFELFSIARRYAFLVKVSR